MKVTKLMVGLGSQLFIILLLLFPVAAIISVGAGSNRNLFIFFAQTLTVLPSLGLYIAGSPEPIARLAGGTFVAICGLCFAIRQYWRIAAWRNKR